MKLTLIRKLCYWTLWWVRLSCFFLQWRRAYDDLQSIGETTLAQLQSSNGEDELRLLLEGVKDPLSSWLDSKVAVPWALTGLVMCACLHYSWVVQSLIMVYFLHSLNIGKKSITRTWLLLMLVHLFKMASSTLPPVVLGITCRCPNSSEWVCARGHCICAEDNRQWLCVSIGLQNQYEALFNLLFTAMHPMDLYILMLANSASLHHTIMLN